MLAAVADDPQRRLSRLGAPTAAERDAALALGNGARVEVPARCLVDLVRSRATTHPDRPAVVASSGTLTYGQLLARSDQLAARLRAAGAGPERIVALAMDRTGDLIASMIAVLDTGAAYLPLDLTHPAERMRFVLRDSGCHLVLADAVAEQTGVGRWPDIDAPILTLDPPPPGVAPGVLDDPHADAPDGLPTSPPSGPASDDRAAYVIYTSGSTGTPKGVVVTARAMANHMAWMAATYPPGAGGVVLARTAVTFDASVWEIWLPLLCGATTYLAPSTVTRDLTRLLEHAAGEGATTAQFVPSMLPALLQEDATPGIARVFCGGESLPAALAERLRTSWGCEVVNLYGPTETTIQVTAGRWDGVPLGGVPLGGVPIGRPIWNTTCYVLDARLEPVPAGVTGELYVAGEALARGYHARPALTATRFVADPFGSPGRRMYRTGDLARWNSEGQLVHVGRGDAQLKLRGFRIEPGEIEAALAAQASVRDAAVVLREGTAGAQLVGYVAPAPGATLTAGDLRAALAARLPEHLVPSTVVVLDALPRLSNGKLDRGALPRLDRDGGSRAPAPGPEQVLAHCFDEVLGVNGTGADDDFFAAGGDSIVAIQLVGRVRRAGLSITARDVFLHPTPAALATIATPLDDVPGEPPGTAIGEVPLTPIMHWLRQRGDGIEGFHQCVVLRIPATVDAAAVENGLQAVLDTHDMLRARLRITASGWTLTVPPRGTVPAAEILSRHDVSGLDDDALRHAVAAARARATADLDPAAGRPVRAALFDAGPGRDRRLLLAIHHLVVDAVSWRVLLADLAMATTAAAQARPVDLPSVPTSFRGWARRLAVTAAGPAVRQESARWLDVLDAPDAGVADADPGPQDLWGQARSLTVTLPADLTGDLVTRLAPAYHATVEDVLLTALAVAVRRLRAARGLPAGGLLVDREGHGRQDLLPGADTPAADLSRTVGWFTTVHPVRLDPGPVVTPAGPGPVDVDQALRHALRRVKEQVRSVPLAGIGYGLLRYLDPDVGPRLAAMPQPRIAVNYLGRIDPGLGADAQGWRLDDALGPLAAGTDPCRPMSHVLTVDAMLRPGPQGELLTADWSWAPRLLPDEDAHELSRLWRQSLHELAVHSRHRTAGGRTPSDLPAVRLDQHDVDRLEHHYPGLADVQPLTPLQEGMLFHTRYDPDGTDLYTVQARIDLDGAPDVPRLRRAAGRLVARHEALRSGFCYTRSGRPVSVILADSASIPVPWRQVDLRRGACSPAEALRALLDDDLAVRFDLAAVPLLRFTLARTGSRTWTFMISSHHILLDGWSLPILLRELFTLYHDPDRHDLPPAPAFSAHLGWLARQDRAAAELAWSRALTGLLAPTLVTGAHPSAGVAGRSAAPLRAHPPAAVRRHYAQVSADRTAALTALARDRATTLNILCQTALTLVLGQCTGLSDVVFGAAVSGRPPDLPGVQDAVGLFVNTVPVRVRLDPARAVLDVARQVQTEQAQLAAHQHLGLTEIHAAIGTDLLFDTVFAFENYPVDPSDLTLPDPRLSITDVDVRDGAHYPLTVVITPGDTLQIRIDHRPDLVDDHLATGLADALLAVLDRVADHPTSLIRDLAACAGVAVAAAMPEIPDATEGTAAIDPGSPDRDDAPCPPRPARRSEAAVDLREQVICDLVGELLGRARVGAEDNFFLIGGNSLLAARLAARVTAALGTDLPVRAVFEAPTPRALRARLGETSGDPLEVLVPLQPDGEGDPLFCLHPGLGIGWGYLALARLLHPRRPMYAVQARGIRHPEDRPETLRDMAADYARVIRQVQPHGPYHLLGWSFGGVAAHAVAVELQRAGEEVALLAMLDAYPGDALPDATPAQAERSVLEALVDGLGYRWEGELPDREEVVATLAADSAEHPYQDRETLTAVIEASLHHTRLLRAHEPQVFSGAVDFFTAAGDQPSDGPVVEWWRGVVDGPLHDHRLPCTHLHVLDAAPLREVARVLDARLARRGAPATEPIS